MIAASLSSALLQGCGNLPGLQQSYYSIKKANRLAKFKRLRFAPHFKRLANNPKQATGICAMLPTCGAATGTLKLQVCFRCV